MADPDRIRATIETYCASFTDDLDTWLGCFADGATVEDPVGTDVHHGKDAIAAFWKANQELADRIELTPTSYVKVVGHEAVFAMDMRMEAGGSANGMGIIDHMTFDDDARITSLRAFWTFDDLGPVD